jgi:conjugative relaxase-like TrwC/TraI family protein
VALGDEATRVAAHRAALGSVLEFVEAKVIRSRVGAGGAQQVGTAGMIAAAFDHWDRRAADPNLHVHVVVANKVQGPDGQWRSVDGRTIHAAAVTVSELHDTLLADEVTRRLPVAWGMRERGERRNPAFEIAGLPDTLLSAFSSRSEAIHEAHQEWAEAFAAKHGRAPGRPATCRSPLATPTPHHHALRPCPDHPQPTPELHPGAACRHDAPGGSSPIDPKRHPLVTMLVE